VLNGEHAISFLKLIDAKIARLFRTKGFQPSVIRPAYQVLGREMNTRHPFAHASLATDGRAIISSSGRLTMLAATNGSTLSASSAGSPR
jgi:hypothetical protein